MSSGWILVLGYGSCFAIWGLVLVVQGVADTRAQRRRAAQRELAYQLLADLRTTDYADRLEPGDACL